MLIGDYTMQCRKHIGTCNCERCGRAAEARAASERRRWYYEEVLRGYAKRLSDNPIKYEDELRRAERFVEALQASIETKKALPKNARPRAAWERVR